MDNEYGIYFPSFDDNSVHYNFFIFNNHHAFDPYNSSINQWDYLGEGNYWNDYTTKYPNATRLNGIWDTPYVIDENNVDNYPLTNLFWNPCDINYDLTVDMKDIGIAAKAYGSEPGDPLWNPYADITGPEHLVPDGTVDMRDIGLIAKNYGLIYR
jgi:hypothetical protein